MKICALLSTSFLPLLMFVYFNFTLSVCVFVRVSSMSLSMQVKDREQLTEVSALFHLVNFGD